MHAGFHHSRFHIYIELAIENFLSQNAEAGGQGLLSSPQIPQEEVATTVNSTAHGSPLIYPLSEDDQDSHFGKADFSSLYNSSGLPVSHEI